MQASGGKNEHSIALWGNRGEGVISGDTQNMRNSEEQTEEQHRTHQNLGSG